MGKGLNLKIVLCLTFFNAYISFVPSESVHPKTFTYVVYSSHSCMPDVTCDAHIIT